ncbi:MAG: amidohydrolase [Desulfovibrionaceae bacterium]|nr:amidohydrolase [Desulfovibrionaceae bacterium]
MHDPYILTNVNGIAMDETGTRFSAVAVENGRIARVGTGADMADLGWPARDMGGKTLLPGFIDTHQHLGLTGQVLNGLDFSAAACLDDILGPVAGAAPGGAPEDWLLGYSLAEFNLRENRLPVKEDLDRACPDRPVMVVHASWHLCVLNSKALALLGLPADLPGMDRDAGGPTGVVRDPGALTHVFPRVNTLMPEAVKVASFRAACEAAMQQGITTLHCLEGGDFGPGDTRIAVGCRDRLPVNTVIWNQVMDIPGTLDMGLPRIGGCICADGAMSAHTAALLESYADQPDNCGTLNFTQAAMDAFVREAHDNGLQVAVHCETDGAIEQVLSAMEKAIRASPRPDHRHRIEHCEIPTPGQIGRIAEAGVIASMQPAFFPYLVDMDEYTRIFGAERMRWIHPYRTMLDAGVRLCGGSDCPITPYGPLIGIQAAVLHPIKEERLTPMEALRLFTLDAAYAGFEERERGSVEPGKLADFAVLAEDPTRVAPERIGSIEVEGVFVSGVAS